MTFNFFQWNSALTFLLFRFVQKNLHNLNLRFWIQVVKRFWNSRYWWSRDFGLDPTSLSHALLPWPALHFVFQRAMNCMVQSYTAWFRHTLHSTALTWTVFFMSCTELHYTTLYNTTLYYTTPKSAKIVQIEFSKHWPSGPMLSISRNVRPSVCLSVCLCVCSLLRYRLTVFLPPLPKVRCPIFLEIQNPWGKVMERSGLRY